MLKAIPFVLWLTIAVTSVGCQGPLARLDVGRTLVSGRDGWQHPERVIEALELRPGDHVAEIGAGSGYWIAALSAAVGPTGRVYAVEVERELVEALEARVERERLENVEVILGGFADPRLAPGRVDLAMTCLTYHHIEDRVPYFRRLQNALSRRGRVVHLDDRPGSPAPFSWFQAKGHWTDPAEIVREMNRAGYERTAEFDFLPVQSFQIFTPVARIGSAPATGEPEAAFVDRAQPATSSGENGR